MVFVYYKSKDNVMHKLTCDSSDPATARSSAVEFLIKNRMSYKNPIMIVIK